MDYKEKYKEALANMQELYNSMKYMSSTDALHTTMSLEKAFPELKESEDERIRNALIEHIKGIYKGSCTEEISKERDMFLAWLEKQENQHKPFTFKALPRLLEMVDRNERSISYSNKLAEALKNEGYTLDSNIVKESIKLMSGEDVPLATMDEKESTKSNLNIDKKNQSGIAPKFKVGDWIVDSNGKVNQVTCVNQYGDGYTLDDETYMSGSWCNSYHLWTIQDAKDGDVLQLGKVTAIFKKYIGYERCTCYCSFCKAGGFEIPIAKEDNVYGCYDDTIPATKEQRDLLFQKMKEADYEWDADKKELKLLITNGGDFFESEICENKPAWGEEDEEKLNQLHKLIVKKAYEEYEIDTEDETLYGKWLKLDNWLKSLKNRVQPQNNTITSDELVQAKKEAYNDGGQVGEITLKIK